MKSFLLLISLLVGIIGAKAEGTEAAVARYDFVMSSPQGDVSGVLVTRDEGDGTVSASVINPFGFSAIQYTYDTDRHKVKLHYVISFLDSWRVKYVLKRDLTALMGLLTGSSGPLKPPYTAVGVAGEDLTLTNTRYGLSYSVKPLDSVQQ